MDTVDRVHSRRYGWRIPPLSRMAEGLSSGEARLSKSKPALEQALATLEHELPTAELSTEELQATAERLAALSGVLQERIRRAVTPSRRELAVQLATVEKLSNAQIALRLGVREDYVRRMLSQSDDAPKRPQGRPRKDWAAELAPLVDAGLEVREIAERLGWAVSTTTNRVGQLRRDRAAAEGGAPKA
jgi:transposase